MLKLNKLFLVILILLSPVNAYSIDEFFPFKRLKIESLNRACKRGIRYKGQYIKGSIIADTFDNVRNGRVVLCEKLNATDNKKHLFIFTCRVPKEEIILIPWKKEKKKFDKGIISFLDEETDKKIVNNIVLNEWPVYMVKTLEKEETSLIDSKVLKNSLLSETQFDHFKLYLNMYKDSMGIDGFKIDYLCEFSDNEALIKINAPDLGFGKFISYFIFKKSRKSKIIHPLYGKNFSKKDVLDHFCCENSSSLIIVKKDELFEGSGKIDRFNNPLRYILKIIKLKSEKSHADEFLYGEFEKNIAKTFSNVEEKIGNKYDWKFSIIDYHLELSRFYFNVRFDFTNGRQRAASKISYAYDLDSKLFTRLH